MALRTGHGRGRGRPHIEVLPADELPAGVPAPARPAPQRDAAGRLLPGDGTKALARAGGRAKAEAAQLGRLLGLADVDDAHPWAPYAKLAREFRDDHLAQLAATVGGGEVGPGVASLVSSAAMQLAASRYLYDQGAAAGTPQLLAESSKQSNDSRQNLIAAHELCAKEALARKKVQQKLGGVAAFRAGLRGESS